jgi:hypothetical protein
MAFEEVQDLDCDTTTAIGGVNKRTNKKNPTELTGYFIGSKETPSKKNKSGIAMLHIFQTAKGNVGVWGKTDLDRKMKVVDPGQLVKVKVTGMVPTVNGDMYKYSVAVDRENTIEVAAPSVTKTEAAEEEITPAVDPNEEGDELIGADEPVEEDGLDAEEPEAIAAPVPVARPKAPKQPVASPSAEQQAKVRALLSTARG